VWQSVAPVGTVSDRIAQQILKLISTDEIKPGDRLPSERDLAALLGVSRPSVREAVKALEAQGRLRVRHGQGVFVASPPAEKDLRAALAQQELTLGELFAMREVLEVPAAGWAASAGDEARIAATAAALDDMNRAIRTAPADFERLRALDSAFHMRIVEAAGNRFLKQTLGVLQEMLATSMETTLLLPGRLAKSRTEHERILDALRRGDSAGARAAARRHIRSAQGAARLRLQNERREAGQAAKLNG
jgi:GntR family transcriptional regulator, transcriptional repressor for pyruvate dehydrogenase complex